MEFKVRFYSPNAYPIVCSPHVEVGLLLLDKARKAHKENFPASLISPRIAGLVLHSLILVLDEKFAEKSKIFDHCNVVEVSVGHNFLNKLLELRLDKRVDAESGITTSIFFKYKIFELDVLEAWQRDGYPLVWDDI